MTNQHILTEDSRRIISAMSEHFNSVYWINLKTSDFEAIKANEPVLEHIRNCNNAQDLLNIYFVKIVDAESRNAMRKFCDFKTLPARLKKTPHISLEFRSAIAGHNRCKAHCMALDLENGTSAIVSFEDIEDDKVKDERLNLQLSYIRGLISGYDMLLTLNVNENTCTYTSYTNTNPEYIAITADTSEPFSSMLATSIQSFCHPDHQDMLMCYTDMAYIKQILKNCKHHSRRFLICNPKGEYKWTEVSFIKFADIDKEPELVAMTLTDVDADERERRSQQAILEDIKSIIRASEMGIWHITLVQGQKPKMEADEKMRELLGLDVKANLTEEEIYEAWHSRISPEALESVNTSVMKMITGGVRDENTYVWIHPTKGKRYVRCGGTAVPIMGGHLLSGYHYDVTAHVVADMRQKKITEDALAANKAKTVFLHNMIHDIRNPLNSIMGFTQLLAMPDGAWSESEKEDHLRQINNAYKMLSMLIDDVIDVADSEHGNYIVNKSEFKVNDMCRNLIQAMEFKRPKDVKMFFTSDTDDNYTIESDERRITQVLSNFITNACKHTSIGEIHLHCSTTENPNHLTFSVADTGEGVPPKMAKEIFKRFKKNNMNVEGSGIGLNICSVIAEKLNGEVLLDTTYTNGARFVFIL